jgi:hypothetical protein
LKKLLLVAMLAALGALTGCSDATLPYLTTVAVNPASPSVAAGHTQQFTAMGTFSNGSTADISKLVTWSSSMAPVGTINSAGLAQSYSQGTSTITASITTPAAGTVTGTGTLTVTAPVLNSVIVTDATAVIPGPNSKKATSIANGTGHQFMAYGLYSDGGERNITNTVTWASVPATVATIATTGRATSFSAGTATITATDPTTTLSGSSSLVVTNASIAGIEVYPIGGQAIGLSMAPLTRQVFSARGVFSDQTTQDITVESTWTSTTPAAATVSNTFPATPNGVVTAVAAGGTTIQASFSGTTGGVPLIVTAASLTSIALTPATSGVAVGSTRQINAVGTFSDGTTQPIILAAAWSVTPSNGSLATVSATGLVTGVAVGAAMVTAKFGPITANATINVEAVKAIAAGAVIPIVNPSVLNIAPGTASQYAAIATLTDGSTQDISASATWVAISPPMVSGTLPVATVSDVLGSSGWVTGNAAGTAIIAAVFGGLDNLSGVTVTSATLKTLAITPTGNVHLGLGNTQQYQATGTFSDSSTQNLTNQVTWSSSLPPVAVMSLTGLATSTGTGTTNVTATSNITTPATTSPAVVLSTP